MQNSTKNRQLFPAQLAHGTYLFRFVPLKRWTLVLLRGSRITSSREIPHCHFLAGDRYGNPFHLDNQLEFWRLQHFLTWQKCQQTKWLVVLHGSKPCPLSLSVCMS